MLKCILSGSPGKYPFRNYEKISRQWFVATSKTQSSTTRIENVQAVKVSFSSFDDYPSEVSSNIPVIIMHGLLGSRNNWRSLSKVMNQRTKRKIIAVDARNHGDSPHTVEMSYQHLAEDVHQLMKDMGLHKACLVGHSMGGRSMMMFALNYPELVEKLVVVDISPVGTTPSMDAIPNFFSAMRNINLHIDLPFSIVRKQVDKELASSVPDISLRQFLLTNLVEEGNKQYRWKVNLETLTNNFHEIANFPSVDATFNGPTIFIGGNNSDYIRRDDHLRIKHIFPNATFKYIDGAGHWVHADKPNEFLDLVCDFI